MDLPFLGVRQIEVAEDPAREPQGEVGRSPRAHGAGTAGGPGTVERRPALALDREREGDEADETEGGEPPERGHRESLLVVMATLLGRTDPVRGVRVRGGGLDCVSRAWRGPSSRLRDRAAAAGPLRTRAGRRPGLPSSPGACRDGNAPRRGKAPLRPAGPAGK